MQRLHRNDGAVVRALFDMGSQPRDVFHLILGLGAKLALIGVIGGVLAALALAQLIKTMFSA